MPRYESALSIVDQMMPAFHTVMWLAFATQDPDTAALTLQKGLDKTIEQLPFLSGTVFEKKEDRNRTYVTWSDEAPKIPFEEMDGTSLPTYLDLARHSMNLHALKYDFFPPIVKISRTAQSLPAFISAFIKLKGGIMVMFAPHHQVMDGGGRQVVFNMIAEHTRGLIPTYVIDAKDPLTRTIRLSKALQERVALVQPDRGTVLDHDTTERHVVSQEFKSPRRKIFELSVKRLNHLRTALNPYTKHQFTIGTLVTAIFWVAISRVRLRRLRHANASLNADTIYTELVMAINTRKYFEGTSLFEEGTWTGNLSTGIQPPPRLEFSTVALAAEDDHIGVTLPPWDSSNGDVGEQNTVSCPSAVLQAVEKITAGLVGPTAENTANFFYSAEKRSLSSQEFDFRQLRDMRALFNGLDFLMTNWGGLDLYPDFGQGLGRPTHARVVGSGFDGAAVILPRRYGEGWSKDMLDRLEVVLSLKEDDMLEVEKSPLVNILMTQKPY